MIKKRFLPVAGILITLAIPLLLAVPNAVASSNCNGVETSIDFQCDTYDTDGISAIIMYVINFMAVGVGIAVVIGIVLGGITYAQSDGEESKAKEGREMIANSIIGLFLFLFLYAGADFLLPGGAFNLNDKPPVTTTGGISRSGGSSSSGSGATGAFGGNFTAATFNIRTTGGDAWTDTRANAILSYIKSVDIVGIQEGKDDSISWLKTRLGSAGYSSAAYKDGEYRAIFWKNSKFTLIKDGVRSLPDGRNLVWAKLKYTSTGSEFYFLTTHLRVWGTSTSSWSTSVTSPYRLREIKEILSFVKSTIPATTPTVFVGDMNSRRSSEEDKLIQSGGFQNSFDIATSKINLNYSSAAKAIMDSAHKSSAGPIDHIYVKNGIGVSRVEVVINQKGSDHVPVEADLKLPGSSGGGSSTSGGTTTNTSTQPTVSFKTIYNFRDAGKSGYIRTGVLYRSAQFNSASSTDKKTLSTLLKGGIIINLRPTKDTAISDVTMIQHPIDVSGKSTLTYYAQFITNATYRAEFRKSIEDVARALSSGNKALIHCAAGKDRTGWLVATIMIASGATISEARNEYMVSQTQLTQEKGTGTWVDTTWFNKAVSTAESQYGSVSNYITKGLGVQQSTIDTIKAKLGR